MPTYQYACTTCDHRFEAVQSFSDDALTQCPECSGRLRKVFSAVGVVFKGSGFYRTDSRAKPSEGGPDKGADKGDKGADKADKGGKAADKGSDTAGKGADKTAAAGASSSAGKGGAGSSSTSSRAATKAGTAA